VSDNWQAVGEAITTQLDEIGMQQQQLSALSQVSVATIREIQTGRRRHRNPRILQELSRALGWPADHLAGILRDGRPGQVPEAETAELASDPSAFLAKLAFVLEHRIGPVVDVLYHGDSDIDITIEIRHSPREP
jgi:hypothetical protein